MLVSNAPLSVWFFLAEAEGEGLTVTETVAMAEGEGLTVTETVAMAEGEGLTVTETVAMVVMVTKEAAGVMVAVAIEDGGVAMIKQEIVLVGGRHADVHGWTIIGRTSQPVDRGQSHRMIVTRVKRGVVGVIGQETKVIGVEAGEQMVVTITGGMMIAMVTGGMMIATMTGRMMIGVVTGGMMTAMVTGEMAADGEIATVTGEVTTAARTDLPGGVIR